MATDRPRLLDLFCGAGGAAVGYARAGFEVVGVDNRPQPNYPFEFHLADAMAYPLDGFDVIHASPPCQRYSRATIYHPGRQNAHPDLVDPCRARLEAGGRPWIIENVVEAPLRNPIKLCGTMFDLRVYRHRNFEAWPPIYWPPMHYRHPERPAAVGRRVPSHGYMTVAGHFVNIPAARLAMGIDWPMTRHELAQAIPPAYTEWLGARLLAVVADRVA